MFRYVISIMIVLVASTCTQAGFVTYSGSIKASDPTFNRPLAYLDGTQSDSFLDYSDSIVHYNQQSFTVTQSDTYRITLTTNLSANNFVLALYQDAFDPTDSSINYLSDYRSQGVLSYLLDPDVTYTLVTSTFSPNSTGNYTVRIGSTTTMGQPILSSTVPEPSSLILLLIAAASIAALGMYRMVSTPK